MKLWLYRFRRWQRYRRARGLELPEVLQRHVKAAAGIELARPVDKTRFVVFDTEMTGLQPDDRLLSLGALRVESGRLNLGDGFHEILDPNRGIPPSSVLIHHIVPDMTAGRPDSAQALPGFLEYIAGDILVAHNARYDLEFINREMIRHFGLPLLNPVVDVWRLSRTNSQLRRKYCLPGVLEDHSLDQLAAAYGLDGEDRHTAFGDALVTGLIFLRLIKALQRFGLWKTRHLLKVAGIH
ncbi:MAG: 3'-5' exonuclease [Thermodesulfobacteriota bacterium]